MKVFVPKERQAGERRLAGTPETARKMARLGLAVAVESGAGEAAFFPDQTFLDAGAEIVTGDEGWRGADIVLTVAPPVDGEGSPVRELDQLRRGALLVGHLEPYRRPQLAARLAARGVESIAMELIPRITRAQTMDALSSQASVAGYKAAVLAASRLGRYFPLLMTAAGTIPPAKVVILGAGVAGLQALATAKRMGAVVEVSDIRPAVAEQVASLGGRFIELPEMVAETDGGYARQVGADFLARQREVLKQHVAAADVVITTAQVPGRPAPKLVPADMVEAMHPGSVIVDLAAPRGGNCELCRPGEEVWHRGVLILGPLNVPSTMPQDASTLYARNLLAVVSHVLDEGSLALDPEDEILEAALLTHGGKVLHPAATPELAKAEG